MDEKKNDSPRIRVLPTDDPEPKAVELVIKPDHEPEGEPEVVELVIKPDPK